MKYLFLSLFLAVAGVSMAQHSPSDGPGARLTPEAIAQLNKEAADFEAQLRIRPEDTELYVKLGFTYARLKKADDAQRAFENAVRLNPKKAIAHYMLGLIYEKKGLKDRAIQAWKACLDNTGDPQMRDTAIRHLHHLGAK